MLLAALIAVLLVNQSKFEPIACLGDESIRYRYPTPKSALIPKSAAQIPSSSATPCTMAVDCKTVCIKACPACTLMMMTLSDVRLFFLLK